MLRGTKVNKAGRPLLLGNKVIDCELVDIHFQVQSISNYFNKSICIYTYPTIETKKCLENLKQLNQLAKTTDHYNFLAISLDIPFSLNRIVNGVKLNNINCLSDFRTREFGFSYGCLILDGLLAGTLADSIILLNPNQEVSYIQNLHRLEKDLDWEAVKIALRSGCCKTKK